jgi:hypothetical protein
MCERRADARAVLVHTSKTSRPTCALRISSRPSRNHRLVIVMEATCERALILVCMVGMHFFQQASDIDAIVLL